MASVTLEAKRDRALEGVSIIATVLRSDDTFWTNDMLARLEQLNHYAADALEIQKRIAKRDARLAKA